MVFTVRGIGGSSALVGSGEAGSPSSRLWGYSQEAQHLWVWDSFLSASLVLSKDKPVLQVPFQKAPAERWPQGQLLQTAFLILF